MESHLNALVQYFSAQPALAMVVIFAGAMLEALAVVGTVIPGSSLVFVGGALVGLGALNFWWTAALAVAGAILGDGASYWLGRRHSQWLLSVWPLRKHPELFERGRA